MKIFSILSILALAVGLAGCEKNVIDYGDIEKLGDNQATLKINYVSQYSDNRKIVLKLNGTRVSNAISGRTPFPGGGYNTGGASGADFLLVNPGAVKLTVALPHKIDDGTDSLQLYTTTLQIEAGKNYVAHITDTAANTKTVLTQEDFVRADSGQVAYRFINLMPNVPAIDLYYGTSSTNHSSDTLLAGNVSYLSITPQFKVKSGQSRTWKIRPAGAAKTSGTILAYYTSSSTFQNQRVYNIFASGYQGLSGTRKPYVSFMLIR